MHAIVVDAAGLGVRHDHRPAPRPGEATVALRVGGICATDLELIRGYLGFRGVLGHEFVGEVIDGPDEWRGQRVVGEINCPCRRCAVCRAGRPTHCPERTVLGIVGRDGVFCEQFSLPYDNLHRIPDGVPDEAAVFVEPLAAALQILNQIHLRPSDRVVVLGIGRLGQLVARVMALTGAQVAGVSRNPARLAMLPATVAGVDADQVDDLAGADVVVDCTGAPEGLAIATRLVRAQGTVVLKTTVHDPDAITPIPWVIEEITLVGSRCGPFAPALRLLASGAVDPTPLISARYGLGAGFEALAAAASPECNKVLLTP